ncbi:MAG: membrane protein insertion efficiency factor YidD [Syntrophales bacterium]
MNLRLFIGNAFRYRRENPGRREFRSSHLPVLPSRTERGKTYRGSSPAYRICGALLVASIFWAQTGFADEALLRGPRKAARQRTDAAEPTAARAGILEGIAEAPVLFYQRFLGPSWVRRCTYYPSCSNYALLAIRKHGAVLGSIMAFDRLQHEADEVRYSPLIITEGEIKGYDPLENNDYWWYTADRPEPAAPAGAGREANPDVP